MPSSPSGPDLAHEALLFRSLSKDPDTLMGSIDGEGRLGDLSAAGLAAFGGEHPDKLNGLPWTCIFAEGEGVEKLQTSVEEAFRVQGYWSRTCLLSLKKDISFRGQVFLCPIEGRDEWLIRIRRAPADPDAERRLRAEKHRFEALFKYANIGILVTDDQGKIILVNKFTLQEFGYTEQELLGKKVEVLIPGRYHHRHEKDRDAYKHHPETRPMGAGRDLFGLRKDGTEFPVEVSLSPFDTEEGLFVIAFIVNITVRKEKEAAERAYRESVIEANERIKKLNDELESRVAERTRQLELALEELKTSRDEIFHSLEKEKELNDLQSRFVSMASHEFRTPLSTILSSVSLLAKYTLTEEQPKRHRHVERIKSAVGNLTGILNEFLSIGRMEEGHLRAHASEFDVQDLIASIIADMQEIKKTGQSFHYSHSGNAKVSLDIELLRNILINLLSNAIKFSPDEGRIQVVSTHHQGTLTVQVKDEGIGISAEDQQHLFERFFRGDNALNIQGTGLGLYIVGRYVQLMNGTIRCESELGAGTTFTLTFAI